MKSGLVFGVGLAIMIAAPAVGASLPPVPTPSLPAVPTVAPQLPPAPTLPTPTLPSTPTVPSLPQVRQVPRIPSVPSVPGVGSPGASSERVPSAGGGGGGSGSGGAARGGGRAASGGGSSGGSVGATRSAGPGGDSRIASARQGGSSGSTTAQGEGPADPQTRAEVRRDRRLRAKVLRVAGCVGALPRPEQRVLTLRAGLGSARPHTRRGVARILRVSTRRVARLERRGVRRLRGLARAGRCSGAGDIAGDIGGGTIPAHQAATLGELAATGLGAGTLAVFTARELRGLGGRLSDSVQVKSERDSSGGEPPAKAAPAPGAEAAAPPPPGAIVERGGADLTIPLLILLAVGVLVFATHSVRRSDAA